jgi:hypothetical protein
MLIPAAARSESPGPVERDAKKIPGLISDLGSPRFEVREQATQRLARLGEPALEALETAARSPDLEIRRRAENLACFIQHRLETERILRPRYVQLDYKDAPLGQAVSDLARKTGLPLEYRRQASEPTISLHTEELTAWKALEHFCREAKLEEKPPPVRDSSNVRMMARPGGQFVVISTMGGTPQRPNGTIVLTPGKGSRLPAFYAGSVRIRALPVENARAFERRPNQLLALLEVCPQADMAWQGVADVQVDEAIDDSGQRLASLPGLARGPAAAVAGKLRAQRIIVLDNGLPGAGDLRLAAIRFQRSDRPSHLLKQLRGQVEALALSPLQPIFTIDEVLKSNGHVFHGSHGEVLKIKDAKRLKDGSTNLVLELKNAGTLLSRLRPNGMAVVPPGMPPGASSGNQQRLDLYDIHGKRLALSNLRDNVSLGANGTITHVLEVTCRPHSDEGELAKLILSARRFISVEIPFELKGVPVG